MDNKRLISFVRSAELGSLSAAAEELGYTPSAVSQLVASLEQELGVSLLVRTTRGVYPTSDAEGLIPIIKDYLSREKNIYDYVERMKNESAGTLSITAYSSVATKWLPDLVSAFTEKHKDITVNIMEFSRPDIFSHLDSGDAELGFLIYADPMPYEWIPLAEEELIAVVPANHRLAGKESYPVSEILNDDFILSSSGREPEVLNMLAKYDIKPKIKYTTYDTPVNIAMIQRGLGVSIVNRLSAEGWGGQIVKLPLDPPQKVTFGIAYKDYDKLSSVARRFMEFAVKKLTKGEE